MLPTITQYKKWSLPSKYALWGLLAAMFPIALLVKDWIVAVPDYAILAFNHGTSEMTIYGAAGDTTETAVIIRGANSHEAGLKAEYLWIRRRYPGYKPVFQAVFENPEQGSARQQVLLKDAATGVEVEMPMPPSLPPRRYDVMTIRNWYGRTHEIFFDITTFWGKPAEPLPGGVNIDDLGRRAYQLLQDAINRAKAEQAGPRKPGK
jgi:hypothetical protein